MNFSVFDVQIYVPFLKHVVESSWIGQYNSSSDTQVMLEIKTVVSEQAVSEQILKLQILQIQIHEKSQSSKNRNFFSRLCSNPSAIFNMYEDSIWQLTKYEDLTFNALIILWYEDRNLVKNLKFLDQAFKSFSEIG